LFFHLQPKNAIINDYNQELINVYEVVRDHIDELIENLHNHENTPDYFYRIRSLDRDAQFYSLSKIEKASRILYLNKTCYNGLYRVNNAGEFNSPYGHYKNPNIINEATLRAVNKYLNNSGVKISHGDYATIIENLPDNAFVYLDPPYHPISETSNFTGYVQGGWGEKDQMRLKEICDKLNSRGIKFLQSNSSANFIKEIYADYEIKTVKATRNINSVALKRGQVDELLIRNY
jgi:DNA adenine methylase